MFHLWLIENRHIINKLFLNYKSVSKSVHTPPHRIENGTKSIYQIGRTISLSVTIKFIQQSTKNS